MDVPTLGAFLRPMFTVTTVWNTGGTGDINYPWGSDLGSKKGNYL